MGVQSEPNVNIPTPPPHAMMCMTDTSKRPVNTARNYANPQKQRGRYAASGNKMGTIPARGFYVDVE